MFGGISPPSAARNYAELEKPGGPLAPLAGRACGAPVADVGRNEIARVNCRTRCLGYPWLAEMRLGGLPWMHPLEGLGEITGAHVALCSYAR